MEAISLNRADAVSNENSFQSGSTFSISVCMEENARRAAF
jgi:hypothetical protein